MSHVTAEWTPLGEVFYRKTELYSMGWKENVDLAKFKIAAASYGGPIALVKDSSQALRVQGTSAKSTIFIFSSSGREIASVRWDGGNLIQMGWSITEDLLCMAEDGTVYVYDIHGTFKRMFTMKQEARESKVIDCQFFTSSRGTGIAVLTGSYHFIIVNSIEDGRIRKFFDPPGLNSPPSGWVIIPQERGSKVLVGVDGDLYLIDQVEAKLMQPPCSQPVNAYIEMALSTNHKALALFTDTGLLWIGSANLQKVYVEFNTNHPSRPEQLTWCGTGAVVCYWDDELTVVGPETHSDFETIRYYMDSKIYMVQERDGLRIIGNDSHDFLQKVPTVSEHVFKVGSMAPGSMLFDAVKEFEKKSKKADEYIRLIKNQLAEGVEQCIEAAGTEFEPSVQRSLLRAASYGKCFLEDVRPHAFENMCKILRVLNAVRDYKVGIPLTLEQMEYLTVPVLVDRLILRHQWLLAIKICDHLKISKSEGCSRILAHWACYKVQQTNVDDEEIARAIVSKLEDAAGISYTEIASKALECGRTELAIRLLDYEPKAADQVPLLMRMKKDQLALQKAIESGDTDLVYTVVMHLKQTFDFSEFLREVRHLPVACSLYVKYCKEQDRKTLIDLYYQDDQFLNSGNAFVQDSYAETTFKSKIECLTKAQMSFTKGQDVFSAKATEEQIRLMEFQQNLNEQLKMRNNEFLGLSLSDTIKKCILLGNHKFAEQLRKDFKVPDKRFYWIKVFATAEARNWPELERFSKTKKSPIGYEPFVEACVKFSARIEAEKYISRVLPENRVKCYIQVGDLEKAAETALNQRNEEELDLVLSKCGVSNRALASRIQEMKVQIRK